jgi:hypothetical protein
MLSDLSIKTLYGLALAEEEGVGTAYEYYAKRLVLARWLKDLTPPRKILIAGLPQKYGASLDFIQLAAELDARVTVVDERPGALKKLQACLARAREQGWFPDLIVETALVTDLGQMSELSGKFDLALSSEVLQRVAAGKRSDYLSGLRSRAGGLAIFCPNAGNSAHTHISGLSGLSVEELGALLTGLEARVGYIDMPPFPPGITRSEEQREQATSGKMESAVMFGLNYYARIERFLPQALRSRQSHIVYALLVNHGSE